MTGGHRAAQHDWRETRRGKGAFDTGMRTEVQRAEQEERWRPALEAYRRALAIDANLLAAQDGAASAEPRAAPFSALPWMLS